MSDEYEQRGYFTKKQAKALREFAWKPDKEMDERYNEYLRKKAEEANECHNDVS